MKRTAENKDNLLENRERDQLKSEWVIDRKNNTIRKFREINSRNSNKFGSIIKGERGRKKRERNDNNE